MTKLSELISTGGDQSKELIKKNLLDLIKTGKSDAEKIASDTAEKIEKWLVMKANGELDSNELMALLDSRQRIVKQYLNSQEIAVRSKLEKTTLALIDLVANKALDAIV